MTSDNDGGGGGGVTGAKRTIPYLDTRADRKENKKITSRRRHGGRSGDGRFAAATKTFFFFFCRFFLSDSESVVFLKCAYAKTTDDETKTRRLARP